MVFLNLLVSTLKVWMVIFLGPDFLFKSIWAWCDWKSSKMILVGPAMKKMLRGRILIHGFSEPFGINFNVTWHIISDPKVRFFLPM